MIPRLGGMHWLMSFIGCVGVLMEKVDLYLGYNLLLQVSQK